MPKYSLMRSAEFALAVAKLKSSFERKGETQDTIQANTGIKQSEISKILNGVRKKPNQAFYELCQYAEIDYPENIINPIDDPRIQQALAKSCDGSEESILLITRLIECASVVMPSGWKNRG